MACRFAKVSEEEIEEGFFYPSDLVNTKTTIPLRVGEERWIYTSTLYISVYIHHYSPTLRGIVVCYFKFIGFTGIVIFLQLTCLPPIGVLKFCYVSFDDWPLIK